MGAKRNGVVVRDYRRVDSSGVALRVTRGKKWREANRGRFNASIRKYAKTLKGRAAGNARNARRRAAKKQSAIELSPTDHLRINAIYAEAARRTAETGIVHHVDHDVPLTRGGKHHPDNLLVVPAAVNLAKGTKTMWEFITS